MNTENCLLSFPFDDLINTGNTGLFEHCLKSLPLELIYAKLIFCKQQLFFNYLFIILLLCNPCTIYI